MDTKEIRQALEEELPRVFQDNPKLRLMLRSLIQESIQEWDRTESRFGLIMEELRRNREEDSRKWDENSHRWEANDRKWEEVKEQRKEDSRKWEENQAVIRELMRKIDENRADIGRLDRKFESTLGALGARFGGRSERSFRNALAGMLEEFYHGKVVQVIEYDSEGIVFGRPEQVELDLVIADGHLIICEIKSSMSKNDMYMFSRKAAFYETKTSRKADQMMVISPMVDKKARQAAKDLGITIYSSVEAMRR